MLEQFPTVKKNKILYYDIPCAFDIETTSFYTEDNEPCACMYGWTLGINGKVMLGRYWHEFINVINNICKFYDLGSDRHLIIYVHNLGFEFQYIRKLFHWSKVFAMSERKPIQAVTTSGIEFRCSYLLSGTSLEKIGSDLQKYKVQKLVGDLDYSLIRHNKTPLTDAEKGYMVNDVKVVMAYIQEKIEIDGSIKSIPLTKTGYVRKYVRNCCLYKDVYTQQYIRGKYFNYRKWMNILTLTPEQYKMLKYAFQGGFTHCSAWYQGKVVKDVGSYDFTSSYPAVIVSEQFPMGKGERIIIDSRETFNKNISAYCCVFDIEFINIRPKVDIDHPISESKCFLKEGYKCDNGRIVSADRIRTTITEQDYFIYKDFYEWDHMSVGKFYRFRREYLPTDFVKAVLKLYNDKTKLKGVKGKEVDYMLSKENINSCFGMMVTDIVRPEVTYDDDKEWITQDIINYDEKIQKYNDDPKRFLSYAWGIWVTAYARRNLFSGILEFGSDYVYSDTDSIKGINCEQHDAYIQKYNEFIRMKMQMAMDHHRLSIDLTEPETIEGIKKPLGAWDFEGQSDMKSLGAKRYMTLKDGKYSLTVSGLNKKVTIPYITEQNIDPFEFFQEDMYIPKGYTGKKIHTYIDYPVSGELIDYTGLKGYYNELSCVSLEESDYTLSLSNQYIDYLMGIRERMV